MMVDGQVRGGVAHGIGNAMLEWMGYDESGQPVTTTFADYLLPSATEVPAIETLYQADAVAAQSARRQGRGRGQHHPDRGRGDLRHRGRAATVRCPHRANTGHAAKAGRAHRQRRKGLTSTTARGVRACEPAPNIFARSTTDGRCSSTASASRTSPRHPRLPRGGALDRAALRHRGGAGDARAHDLRLAQDRRAGAARLPDPAQPCRSAGAAAVLGDLGRGDVRPDGPHARSRRRLLLRLRRDARACWRRAGRNSPTTWSPSTSTCATTTSTPPMRSCRRRSTAASPRTSRATRRSMPAWSRSATTASSSPARSSSPPAARSPTSSI